MKRHFIFISIFLCTSFIVFNISCNTNNGTSKLEFYYFPEKNVYYDVTNKSYLYSVDGAKTWSSIISTNEDDAPTLGKKEVIYYGNDSVWKDNEAHRQLYGGKLYNLVEKDTAATPVEVTERKPVIKKERSIQKSPDEKERKRPVRDFFKRLFGKRKDKEPNNQ